MLGYIAGALALVGHSIYIFATLKKSNQPKPVTWGIWALTDWGLLASFILSGAGDTRWLQLVFAVGNTIVAVLSIKGGKIELTRLNFTCLALSTIAIITLVLLRNPEAALLIGLFSKTVGFVPTGLKLWYRKEGREYYPAWVIWTTANLVNLVAVKHLMSLETLLPLQYSSQCILVLLLNLRIPRTPS